MVGKDLSALADDGTISAVCGSLIRSVQASSAGAAIVRANNERRAPGREGLARGGMVRVASDISHSYEFGLLHYSRRDMAATTRRFFSTRLCSSQSRRDRMHRQLIQCRRGDSNPHELAPTGS